VDYGNYILGRRADGPCEYRAWISVIMQDLVLEASLELFAGWVGQSLASIFSESASSKFPAHI